MIHSAHFIITTDNNEYTGVLNSVTIPGIRATPQEIFSNAGRALVDGYIIQYDELQLEIPLISWDFYDSIVNDFCNFSDLGANHRKHFMLRVVLHERFFEFVNCSITAIDSIELRQNDVDALPILRLSIAYDFYTSKRHESLPDNIKLTTVYTTKDENV